GAKSSARPRNTSTPFNVKARITSRRNAAFLWLASIKITESSGTQILMGSPGNPAPEPTSTSCRRGTGEDGRKRRCAAKRDSPKCRVTTLSGSRTAVKLNLRFQRSNIAMYIDMLFNCRDERGAARKGSSSAEMRTDAMEAAVSQKEGVNHSARQGTRKNRE